MRGIVTVAVASRHFTRGTVSGTRAADGPSTLVAMAVSEANASTTASLSVRSSPTQLVVPMVNERTSASSYLIEASEPGTPEHVSAIAPSPGNSVVTTQPTDVGDRHRVVHVEPAVRELHLHRALVQHQHAIQPSPGAEPVLHQGLVLSHLLVLH
jgi:hypothetical protein